MVKKTTKRKTTSKKTNIKNKIVETFYNYNKEFNDIDHILTKTKPINFQQWLYSIMLFVVLAPLFFNIDSNQAYLSVAIICLFGLFLSVYIAQSNRILVLLSQIKNILEKK